MSSSHPLVERFRSGDVPEPFKAAAARGALPLPPEDLVEILFLLRKDPSKEIQRDIVKTLEGLPAEAVSAVASNPATPAPLLDFLARASIRRDALLEHVVKNPAAADATLALLGQHGSESVLEFLSFNQVRLTRAPAIMQAMLANPKLPLSVRRRLEEIAELHAKELQQQARRAPQAPAADAAKAAASPAQAAASPAQAPASPAQAPASPAQAPASPAAPPPAGPAAPVAPAAAPPAGMDGAAAPAATLPPADAAAPAEPSAAGEPEDGLPIDQLVDLSQIAGSLDQAILDQMAEDEATEEELRLAQKLLTMTVPEKVQLALKGNRDARMVLIRDASKQVQEAVINSPKITDNEIERIAKMRSVSEDVIRLISNKREAMKIYSVINGLVHNPKCPQHIAMQLLQQLQNRDLQQISKDKNIPDVVRRHALITLDKRMPKGAKKH